MAEPQFVHLRLHSEYSVSDGIVRIDDAVARAVADRMPALALTDLGNLFGLVKFYRQAQAHGVQPIAGCDLWIENERDATRPHRLLVLVQSRDGYRRLCELLTRAYRDNQHRGRARVRREWFAEHGTDGLIALCGARHGEVGEALLAGNAAAAEQAARAWSALFPGRYYLELQRTADAEVERCTRASARLAARCSLPVVATHPVQFAAPEDYRAHEARVCIAEGWVLADQRRPRAHTAGQYFRTQAEMAALFADLPVALANSVEIARRCHFELELGKVHLPRFPTPGGESLEDYLRERAAHGLERRLAELFPDAEARAARASGYRERLDYELATIATMGFAGYFLIVADFIDWARSHGVPVGPGRGSGAGSLVAYSLGITDLDPLRYGLLFERFLNPERVSMPDFDIDFCQDGRDRVIDYVRDKYGADSVSQIATFGTMAAKAVVRDVGRVLDLPFTFCDQFAKLIPAHPGRVTTLRRRTGDPEPNVIYAREVEPQIDERERNEEDVRELLALAESLEGVTRNVGMHAGGVLIAPGPLTRYGPLYYAEGSRAAVSQFDKDDVEAIGLVKFDFLGLTTLTVLDWAVKLIRARGGEHAGFALDRLPLDDAPTYRLLGSGNTTAVFQLESRGMRDLIRRARPDRFDDIIALVALYRPGPMDLIPDYIERKHGKPYDCLHPLLEPVLAPTYGIMVYQEQVMQAAQICAGYPLGGADLLRRAMGKKKPEEMAQQRALFVAGAAERGIGEAKANEIFDYMEKFAGYGFNKSHAAAYALLAYQTAYLKAHYPAEFMAANLSAVMADTDKVQQFVEDARAQQLAVLAPDINASGYRFAPVDARTIRYGLGAIKGTGQGAIEAIVAARRASGPFRDLFDFCRRVDARVVNRRVVEALVRAGAFDALEADRAALYANVPMAIAAADQAARSATQAALFGGFEESAVASAQALVKVPRWSAREQLAHEKAALGLYLSGHPFDAFAAEVRSFARTRLAELQPAPYASVRVAGIIHSLRMQQTRRGRIAVIELDDGSARIEVAIGGELHQQRRALLAEDALLIVEGRVLADDYNGGVRMQVERLFDLAEARNTHARCLKLHMNGGSDGARLRRLLEPHRAGPLPVEIVYHNGRAHCELALGEPWKIHLRDSLYQDLCGWLSEDNVRVVY
jgi:DNA polymerase-3 subunit alpha